MDNYNILKSKLFQKCQSLFPDSFINYKQEFIIIPKYNFYFRIDNISSDLELKYKILEYLSRPACKFLYYCQDWRNIKIQDEILSKINILLDTEFSKEEMGEIYTYVGNGINHSKLIEFFDSGFDFSVLDK